MINRFFTDLTKGKMVAVFFLNEVTWKEQIIMTLYPCVFNKVLNTYYVCSVLSCSVVSDSL